MRHATRSATPLAGRAAELARLSRLLDASADGSPGFVVVWGEPGIGKTRLLWELTRDADRRGFLVLDGRAAEFERGVPFAVLIDAMDAYLASLDYRETVRVAGDGLAELAAVFPGLGSLGPAADPPAGTAERFRSHQAIRGLLERLALRQPLLLALDDLHWGDGASLETAAHLLRRPPEAGVLVATALRTGQAPSTIGPAIVAAVRDGSVEQLELAPLTPSEADPMLRDTSPAERERVYRESGGNPFFIEQLAHATNRGTAAGGRPGDVPANVAVTIQGELEALSPAARALAAGAAVAGDPFDVELAARVAELPTNDALTALDELAERGLAKTTDVPSRFRFRHPLVRHAVYDGVPPGSRLAAHARASAVLAEQGAPATVRAHHVEAAAGPGDGNAVAVLREAGRAAVTRDPATAARWFRAALRTHPASAPADERLELLTELAGALAATGEFAESRAALLESIDLLPADDSERRGRLTAACAGVEQLLGRHQEAHARLISTLDALPNRRSAEAAELMTDLAMDAFYRMEYDAMRDWAAQAVETARPLEDTALTGATIATLAMGGAFSGAIADARLSRDEAAALVDAMPDERLALRLSALANLAAAELYLDMYSDAVRHAERGLAIGRATGQDQLFPAFVPAVGYGRLMCGRVADAAAILDDGIEAARLSRNHQALAWNLLNRSAAALAAGDVQAALATGEESVELTRELGESLVSAWAGALLASPLLETGRPERGIELLLGAAGGEELSRIPGGWRAYCLELLARCRLAIGRRHEAERAVEHAHAVASSFGLALADVAAARGAAALALADGGYAEAAERAGAAAARADAAGMPIEAATARVLAGRALAAAGAREAAIAELERAESACVECGAELVRRQATAELRRHGRGRHVRNPHPAGLEGLSDRERQIAELVRKRRTNPQIAAELFLSTKTVETQLRNIFRKLGVSSRVDVAQAVERAERESVRDPGAGP